MPMRCSISAVAIDEAQTELPREVAPNRGLATAGHADEGDGDI
jgi:hypothetical protein